MDDNEYVARVFHIESGGDPNAQTGSNRGLGQFGPREEAQYGINDSNRTDYNAQAAAVLREKQAHSPFLSQVLGREPSPGEYYLAHQQGIAGGPALLAADPNIPAWQAIRQYYGSDRIAQQAITGNIHRSSPLSGLDANQISAGDFRNYWINKFENPSAATASRSSSGVSAAQTASPGGLLTGAPLGTPDPDTGANDAILAQLAKMYQDRINQPAPQFQPLQNFLQPNPLRQMIRRA